MAYVFETDVPLVLSISDLDVVYRVQCAVVQERPPLVTPSRVRLIDAHYHGNDYTLEFISIFPK